MHGIIMGFFVILVWPFIVEWLLSLFAAAVSVFERKEKPKRSIRIKRGTYGNP